jgi:hypothetical protein
MRILLNYLVLLCLFILSQSEKLRATDNTIDITGVSNSNYAGILPGLSSGNLSLGGVNFNIPSTYPYFNSNTDQSVLPDLSATLSMDISGVSDVCLLLNTGNTYSDEMAVGDQIGAVTLTFASGSPQVVPLKVGVNIREWAIGTTAQSVINTFTDPNLQQVWSGDNNGGILSVVDMLTIPVSGDPTLTGITIADQSEASIGNVDPTLNLRGVTVQSVPEPSIFYPVLFGASALGYLRRRQITHG